MIYMGSIHLTETGLHAGRRLCLTERSDGAQNAHAALAPLHLAEFRARCCHACLTVWAREAYDDTDEMPDWVLTMRNEEPTA
jgi:hypothetical protein